MFSWRRRTKVTSSTSPRPKRSCQRALSAVTHSYAGALPIAIAFPLVACLDGPFRETAGAAVTRLAKQAPQHVLEALRSAPSSPARVAVLAAVLAAL